MPVMPLTDIKKYRVIPFTITFAVILLVYFFPHDELKTLMVFIVLLLAFSVCKFDARILIGSAILLLIIQGVLTSQNEDVSVELLAVISYWLLGVGIICIIVDLFRKKGPVQTVA
jgi:hypothetical protein